MADPSFNYSFNYLYTSQEEHREANLFREEYYSSTDTKIYMDNEEQTEIGFIQYEIQEQLKPVYGYNSRTFDDVVIGNRIVTGTFTVPIKNKEKQVFVPESTDNYTGEVLTSGTNKYNLEEEENLYDTEWFGSTARNIDRHNNTNIDTDALVKLIALNYDVNTNSSTAQYIKALKEFQKLNNLGITGILNQVTKNALDEQFNMKSAISIDLSGTTGYDNFEMTRGGQPLDGNGIIIQKIPTTNGNVYWVMDSNGKKHYIKE